MSAHDQSHASHAVPETAPEIVPVDPEDADQFAQWHAVYAAAERAAGGTWAVPYALEELHAEATAHQHHTLRELYAVRDGDRLVGGTYLDLPLLDNQHLVQLTLSVHPDHWGRGHGRALLAHAEARARHHGRTHLITEATFDHQAPPDAAGTRVGRFLDLAGFGLAIGDLMRVLELPTDPQMLDRLVADAAPHHTAYEIRSFVAPTPEELLPGVAELAANLMTEAPMGELAVEPESADHEAFRDRERMIAAQGRTKYTTVAIAEDGTVIAYTDLLVSKADPGRVFQWGTLVRRDHRGHRLGMAIKAANLRFLQEHEGDVRTLVTYNAEVNAPMVAVNDAMGFRPVARLGEFQKVLVAEPTDKEHNSP